MKYFINTHQHKILTELTRTGGNYLIQPVYNVIEYFNKSLNFKQKIDSFKDYYLNILGLKLPKEIDRREILNFFDYPEENFSFQELTKKENLSSFAYFLAKRFTNLKEGIDLVFFVAKEPKGSDREYFFFDPTLKIFVGKIYTVKNENLSGKSYRVKLSATDEELIGGGYGTKMYMTLIEKFDYLASDYTLFEGAYKMWKHVLPKFVNVWGVIEGIDGNKYEKIDPNLKKSVIKYDNFVASTHDEIK